MDTPPNTHPEPAVPLPEGYELRPRDSHVEETDYYRFLGGGWFPVTELYIGRVVGTGHGYFARKIVPEPAPRKSGGDVVYGIERGYICRWSEGGYWTPLNEEQAQHAADMLNSHVTVKRQRDALLALVKRMQSSLPFERSAHIQLHTDADELIKEVEETA